MLLIEKLKKSYGERVLFENLSVVLRTGETLGIIGPSGCGKSTLLNCIAGIISYDQGELLLEGKPIEQCTKDIGFNFQEHNLFPWLNVEKNLALGLVARGVSKTSLKEQVQQVANDLSIGHLLHCYPRTLSGGEKQRVAIGRILAYKPKLLLLDEPSSALDAINKEKFQDTLVQLKAQYPMTTVLVTHSIEEAVYLSDRIMVMNRVGQYTIREVTLKKDPSIRKDNAFFEACKRIREVLEEGNAYV